MAWNHLSADGMATNTDPIAGGIVDKNIVSGLWFVVPNHPELQTVEGFESKEYALSCLALAVLSLKDENHV